MEMKYVHVKTRSQFGKQCIFDDAGPRIEANVPPDRELMNDYVYRNPCHVGVQNVEQMAVHEVQTTSVPTRESGMSHTEGGWPKELNPKDEEATARFRRRVEKDEIWPTKMRKLMQPMERCILQNNAVDIYENFFDDMLSTELVLPIDVRTVNVYEDPQTFVRPITHLSWSPAGGKRLAVSYCSREFEREPVDRNLPSYIWEIENPNKPLMALNASRPSVVLEYNPRDPSMLASGLMSGQVCNWDIRQGAKPAQMSHLQFSHRNPANLLLWTNLKTNTEFFSASTGGSIKWWDLRKLREPTETLVMDLENPSRGDLVRAIGVSSLQFEATMSAKFMAGMENGVVVNGSRKGKNPQEKLATRFLCHAGPVVTLERNPFSAKNFLTVGGWVARIWAEDTREGNLAATKRDKTALTGGCWSTSRYSVFYLIDESGVVKIYDLLVGVKTPAKTIRLCEDALKAITPHEEGTLVAVGNDVGNVYLVESSEGLTSNFRNDKALVNTYLDRSSRYVKAVDNRLKEIRLGSRRRSSDARADEPISSNDKAARPKTTSKEAPGRESSVADKKGDERVGKSGSNGERDKRSRGKVRKLKDTVTSISDPELDEAEARYYEIIAKETEKYAEIAALEEPVEENAAGGAPPPLTRRKKRDESKVDGEASGIATRDETERARGRKSRGGRSTRPETRFEEIVMVRRAKESSSRTDERETEAPGAETAKYEDDSAAMIDAAIKLKKSAAKRGKTDVKISGKMKKREARGVRVTMKKPCVGYVCRPEVCCMDEIGDEKSSRKLEKPASAMDHSRRDSRTTMMIDEMLANLPKVASPEELGHLLDPITERVDENVILTRKDERPRLLDERMKVAKRETERWRDSIVKRELPKPTRVRQQPRARTSGRRSSFSDIYEDGGKTPREDSAVIEGAVGGAGIEKISIDETESAIEGENYGGKGGKTREKTGKAEISIDCEPVSVRFGEKEIKEIIGIRDAPRPPSRPKFDESRKKVTKTRGDYPRISAAAILKSNAGDKSPSK